MASNRINPLTGRRYDWEARVAAEKAADPKNEIKEIEQRLALLKRQHKADLSQDRLMDFVQFTMPDPANPDDVERSLYEPAPFHRAIAQHLEELERGEFKQLILTLPPRAGKTELATKRFVAWFMGRNPFENVAVATYSDTMAEDYGSDIRAIMNTPQYRLVFPKFKLRRGATAKSNLQTEKGGRAVFVGAGGALTGRGAGLLVIDDIMKNSDDARSQAVRDSQWEWFTKVAMTRRMGKKLVIIIMCMTGDTPVLLANGQEKALRDIRPGDMVASYKDGRLVASKVLNHINNGPDFCYKIRMTSGITVKANERHPFLVDCDGDLQWKRLRELKKGDAIVKAYGVNGRASPASTTDASNRLNAKATACPTTINSGGQKVTDLRQTTLDREEPLELNNGTASRSTLMNLWSNAKKGAVRYAKSFLAKMFARTGAGSCASITATTQARSEVCCVTTVTSPSDTEKQRKSCSPPLDTYEITRDEIFSIEPAGREDVYDIQVEGTENFIANGLVSHNTRWHSDDIVGRLTDPENPRYSAEEAKGWKIINIPAIAEEDDVLGRKPGEPLWPERYPLEFLQQQQRLDPLGFAALYQQRPTVADGVLFKRENIDPAMYTPDQIPDNLRIYCASDHAVATGQRNDFTVMMKVGIDEFDNMWVLDCFRDKVPADKAVEAMLEMAGGKQRPLLWWAEKGHISKSIGPFLRKRMMETGTYINLVEVTPAGDKEQRAQSIAARVAMGKVKFPRHAVWTEKVVNEMLAFPNGTHDDAVDTLAYLGLGLRNQFKAGRTVNQNKVNPPKFGTLEWVKLADRWQTEQKMRQEAGGF